jgi:hypothetical protein
LNFGFTAVVPWERPFEIETLLCSPTGKKEEETMKMVNRLTLAAALVAISAGSAMAGFNVTPGGTQDSVIAVGAGAGASGAGNAVFTHNHAGADFIPGDITITGTLTEVNTGTWGNEARFEICSPTVCRLTGALTATGNFTGSLAINALVTQASMSGLNYGNTGNVGVWTFEAFESYNDSGIDARWSNLSITIGDGTPPPPPPPAFSGSFVGTPNTLTHSNKAFGTTIWDHLNPQPGLTDGGGEGLNIYSTQNFPPTAGNEVAYAINHAGGDLILSLTGIAVGADLDLYFIDSTGTPAGLLGDLEFGGNVNELVTVPFLPAGTYYAVVDTFAPTATGSPFSLTYTPEPATFMLLALGAFGLSRRCR